MTARQWYELCRYYELEPFGSVEEDMQHSFTRSAIYRAQGVKKSNRQPVEIRDVSLVNMRESARGSRSEKQSVEEQKAMLMGMARRQNKSEADKG